MPIYAYRCNNCGHQFEVRQRFSEEPLRDCPVCVGELRRVVNSVGVVFKGSGFYVTDSRNGSSNGAAKNGAAAPADKTEKPEATTESNKAPESTGATSQSTAGEKPEKSKKSEKTAT